MIRPTANTYAAALREPAGPAADALRQRVTDELLPFVRQPAQYIGGELNQLAQPGDWQRADVRVAIAFPDAYTIGMSHLGCQILYWLANHTPGVCAERVYCPWLDAEAIMRAKNIPLFTWDNRRPVASADLLAVSLQYELAFTNVLNLLDLAGIPLRSADRTNDHPLVIAGGPQADNPEPMADFLDLIVIGDGEASLAAILDTYAELKRAGVPRREMLLYMARRFPWAYVPSLYEPTYHDDNTFAGLLPLADGIPLQIDRCQTPDLGGAPFPTRPLVPWTEVVHDRISIEIMRGCPQLCRFCHAGYTKRPLTLRTVDEVLAIAEDAYRATGHHEIGLLSLSTADYPFLRELAERVNTQFADRKVNLSFPSLRIDKMLQNIPWMASAVRKGSITMAVEAAKDDMRAAIRKKVTDGNLMDGVREVYKAGWNRVKLYFMSGFPGERDDDIVGIWELANAVSDERRRIGRPAASVTASVGWLVPKPFTPLQWMAQPPVDYFRAVREKLLRLSRLPKRGKGPRAEVILAGQGGYGSAEAMAAENEAFHDPDNSGGRWRGRKSAVRIITHDPERSILEGVFARGDRRLSHAIEAAWRHGARFDGWDEGFVQDRWTAAFDETGLDPAFYAHRERGYDELLPWSHIGLHLRNSYLERSYDDMFDQIKVTKPGATIALPVVG